MSDRASQAELAERIAKVWDRPRLKVDMATLLEVYPHKFSLRVLGIIFGFLACEIGFFASQPEIGRAVWAGRVPLPAFAIGGAALVLSFLGLIKMVSGRGQFRTAQDFAEMIFNHVLAQPGAPNYHFFERVALPETLGVAPDREDDNDNVADAADSLHAWMERSREAIRNALIERAGIEADVPLFENAPATAADMVDKNIQAMVGPSRVEGETLVELESAQAKVERLQKNATFSFRAPESVLGHLTPDGRKLADAQVHATMSVAIVHTPVDAWYVVDAGLGEIKPGAAEDTTEMV